MAIDRPRRPNDPRQTADAAFKATTTKPLESDDQRILHCGRNTLRAFAPES